MQIFILVLVCAGVAALVAFLVKRNVQDKASFEKQLNETYHKPADKEGDIETDERMH